MSQNDFFSFSLDSSDSDISEPDDQPPLKRPCLTAPAPKPKPKVNNRRDSINSTLHSDPQRDAFIKSLKCFRSTGGKNVWTEREKKSRIYFCRRRLHQNIQQSEGGHFPSFEINFICISFIYSFFNLILINTILY